MNKKIELFILGIISLIAILFLLLFLKIGFQIDLTDKKIYSIKDSTTEIINNFDQPLYINWWKSENFQTPRLDIMEKLFNNLSSVSDFTLITGIKNPSENDVIRLRELGLREEQIEITTNQELMTSLVFSGVEISYLGKTAIIPFISDPVKFEFELAVALDQVLNGGKDLLAFFPDSNPENSSGSYIYLTAQLSRYFDLVSVTPDNPLSVIPDVMIVPDRRDYFQEELYAIDRTIQSGKPVIFLVDGLKIDPLKNDTAFVTEEKSIIWKMLELYGVSCGSALILDRNSLMFSSLSGMSQRYNKYDFWFKGNDYFNLLWASPLKLLPVEGIQSKVLIESSEKSWLNEGKTNINPALVQENPYYSGPYPVVVELEGKFPPVFTSSEPIDHKEGKIMVIGSSLSVSDLIQLSGSYKNIDFIRNSIYRMEGKDNLYNSAINSIISNELYEETIVNNRGHFSVLFVNLFFIPLSVIVAYAIIVLKRRRNEG